MAITESKLQLILADHFPNAKIKITDLVGDKDHYSLEIIDSCFKGLSLIKQHKLVKNALVEILKGELHAITIKTRSE